MKILITGFAGTIGSEFTKQLLKQGHKVIGIDNNEWSVALAKKYPNLIIKLGDFSRVKGSYDLIIHCAAYKHVDLLESNKREAHLNNVIKTRQLYHNTKGKILFISTDKAVEPISFYGKTKKDGEDITLKRGGIVARLGNVIHSNGSVVPKWEKCLIDRETIPITNPEMTRYMIPVDIAVESILSLLPNAKRGSIIVPEMGKPINILNLANEIVSRKIEPGLAPFCTDGSDGVLSAGWPYKVIGIRPGEKIHEKIILGSEKIVYKDKFGMILERTR